MDANMLGSDLSGNKITSIPLGMLDGATSLGRLCVQRGGGGVK